MAPFVFRRVELGLLLVLLVGGCADASSPSPSSTLDASSHQPLLVTETARDPDWVVTIAAPRSKWSAFEAILVKAELRYIGPGEGTEYFGSGSGPLAFGLAEVGGTRVLGGAMTADCARYEIRTNEPLILAYTKSGGFTGEDPNAPFYRQFLEDPLLHLPAGTWTLSVWADLVMPPGCGDGRAVKLQASITLIVE